MDVLLQILNFILPLRGPLPLTRSLPLCFCFYLCLFFLKIEVYYYLLIFLT